MMEKVSQSMSDLSLPRKSMIFCKAGTRDVDKTPACRPNHALSLP